MFFYDDLECKPRIACYSKKRGRSRDPWMIRMISIPSAIGRPGPSGLPFAVLTPAPDLSEGRLNIQWPNLAAIGLFDSLSDFFSELLHFYRLDFVPFVKQCDSPGIRSRSHFKNVGASLGSHQIPTGRTNTRSSEPVLCLATND
jgi:hypothetical protein